MDQLPAPEPSAPTGPRISGEPHLLNEGVIPVPPPEAAPISPTEPEWEDGEEVYTIYRPDEGGADDDAA